MSNLKAKYFAKPALFAAALIWGSSFFIVKNTVDTVPPNMLLAFRFTLGFLILSVFSFKEFKKLNLKSFGLGALAGLFLFMGYSVQTIGIQYTTPSKNAFLTAVYCVIVPFLFWAVNKTRPDRFNILASVLCVGGIGLISLSDGFTSVNIGDVLTLISGFFFASHIVVLSKAGRHMEPLLLTLLQFFFCAVYSWAAFLIFEKAPATFESATASSAQTIGVILYLGIMCTAVTIFCQTFGQKYTAPAAASIILSLESVFGVLFSALIYGETFTVRQCFGFAMIFIAIIISETKLSFLRRKSVKS